WRLSSIALAMGSVPSEKHKSLEVSYNTRLPLLSEDTISYRVLLPNGQKAWLRKNDGTFYLE
ncbi:hypothetical protein, partial [Citrobacter youngae]|uniref:hypothetical protein n=1 Tax=Citrobacter youngae TaxID=133448 RepID=UPI001954F290